MNFKSISNSWYKRFTFHGLSIQQRLPLLICVLLSAVIITFSIISYYGVKKSAIEIGKNRLRTLTDQLSDNFGQSARAFNKLTAAAVRQDAIKKCILSKGTESQQEANAILTKLRKDSTWLLIELLDSNRIPVLHFGDEQVATKLSLDTIFSSVQPGVDSFRVGNTVAVKDTMYYSVLTTVTDRSKVIGYLVVWQILASTPQAIEQVSAFIGAGSKLYIGNQDGSLWTNLIKPVAAPPIDIKQAADFFEYTNAEGKKVIATIKPVLSTQWLLLIEFSQSSILETATRFLRWIIIAGSVLIALSIFITWLMSRNIIRPLNQLTAAATAIAAGEHSMPVKVNRMDELGKLTQAFNTMAGQIQLTQQDLENKVQQRTVQLETANKELEAFSYSISHDLRSPLRGIIGFTSMFKEQYGGQLDSEGNRLIEIIRANTLKMGNLIDDLLEFSRLGRQDITKRAIPTDQLVADVIKDLTNNDSAVAWNIHPLPESYGDKSTLKQVWVNFISNAIKYSRKVATPRIEIGSGTDKGYTVFFVKDNGVGFDTKYKDKLFKVFQRLHSAHEFEGSGVGLAIVERIVSRHGGKVWVEAEKNVGATFYFSLPEQ